MSPARLLPTGHPDRSLSIEEVTETAYEALVLRLMQRGVSEHEAVLAIESLAQAHLDTLRANDDPEFDINCERRTAGFPERPPPVMSDADALEEQRRMLAGVPPTPSSWPWVAAGAAFAVAMVAVVRWIA